MLMEKILNPRQARDEPQYAREHNAMDHWGLYAEENVKQIKKLIMAKSH